MKVWISFYFEIWILFTDAMSVWGILMKMTNKFVHKFIGQVSIHNNAMLILVKICR